MFKLQPGQTLLKTAQIFENDPVGNHWWQYKSLTLPTNDLNGTKSEQSHFLQ